MNSDEIKMVEHFGIETVSLSDLKIGDTIIYGESLRTVGRNDIAFNGFMGTRLLGDASIKTVDRLNI